MSTITRERLEQLANFRGAPVTRQEEQELARIALASLEAEGDSEPVAFINGAWKVAYYRSPKELGLKIGDKLFAAPPAPMLPEEMPKGLAGQIVSLLAHNIGDKFLAQKIWNACRAAMLQGAEPVSNRDELPEGWVACSERMPMDGFDVLCASEFDGPGDWRRKVGYWHRGKWVVYGASWTPTHWMPLPSPPFK
ncbi:DUF551 domain-containing protein [Enterobacter hormaechei]